MNQEKLRVKFSLKTKLLTSVVLLLIIVIAFLNVSTIILLKEDKRAYIYQAQATEAVLAGKEFTYLANRAINTLRLSLAAFDPRKPITEAQRNTLLATIKNQDEVLGVRVSLLDPKTGQTSPTIELFNEQILKTLNVKQADLHVTAEQIKTQLELINKEEVTFFNLSKIETGPVLGIALSDLSLKNNPTGLPVAFGFVPLHAFLKDLKGADISIVNSLGHVLYDTDPATILEQKNIFSNPLFQYSHQQVLTTGAQEYVAENESWIGSFFKPGLGITAMTKISLKKAMQSAQTLTEKFIILAGMAIGGAIIFALLFARRLTAPLKRLYEATKEVASGHFDLKFQIKSKDEIGALSSSFSVMSQKIQELIKESMEKVRLQGEIEIANAVQQSLIPPNKHNSPNIKIESHYESASECGGDWWGLFTVDNKLAITIADATGHGVPSALITAAARSCFSVVHKLSQENPNFNLTPSEMLRFANRAIYDASSGKIMMTYFAAVVDFNTKSLTYSSAGHNPPWFFKKTGEKYSLTSLTAKGSRLGERPDVHSYSEKTIAIGPDDILFLYTDGILEGTNPSGEQYGKKKMKKIIEDSLVGGPELIIKSLMKDFKMHNGDKPLDDDVTLAAAMFLGGAAQSTSAGEA